MIVLVLHGDRSSAGLTGVLVAAGSLPAGCSVGYSLRAKDAFKVLIAPVSARQKNDTMCPPAPASSDEASSLLSSSLLLPDRPTAAGTVC